MQKKPCDPRKRSFQNNDRAEFDGGTNPAGGEAYALNQGIDLDNLWTTARPGVSNFSYDDLSLVSTSPARGAGADLFYLFGADLRGDVSIVSIFMSDEQAGNNKWIQWWTKEYGTSSRRPELVVVTN